MSFSLLQPFLVILNSDQLLAAMLVTCGEIVYPSYVAATWHIYLCLLALLVVQGVITMQSTKFIGWVNKIGTVFNVVVVFIFVIWFPAGSINSPKTNNSHDVWTTFENGTEWPIGWATIMGTSLPNHWNIELEIMD